jgi:hypothetical protein
VSASPSNSIKIITFYSYACASGYMRYPDKTYGTDHVLRYYGHIRPVYTNSPNNCVARWSSSDGHQFLINQTCSMLDDASQENQYWQLELIVDGFENIKCVFILTFEKT